MDDLTWDLVCGHFLPAMGYDLRVSDVSARFLDHEDLHRFAGFFVRHTDTGTFRNAINSGDDRFNFVREDVEARDDNHILFAVHDAQETLFVEDADIACSKEAVSGECFFVCVRLVPVALRHLGASNADFSTLTNGYFIVIVVQQLDVGRRHRKTARAREFLTPDRYDRHQRRGFRQPVTFGNVPACQGFPVIRNGFDDRRAAADGDFQLGEIYLLGTRMHRQPCKQRVHGGEYGDASVLDGA